MTPAINLLKKQRVIHHIHTYDHGPVTHGYGEEAADKLGVSRDRLFKTLVCMADNKQMMAALVPVSGQLDVKAMARAVKAKKIKMADKKDVERITGYLPGGVSPIGQKKRMPMVIDASAEDFETIYVSAGRRGLQVELPVKVLCSLVRASIFKISR